MIGCDKGLLRAITLGYGHVAQRGPLFITPLDVHNGVVPGCRSCTFWINSARSLGYSPMVLNILATLIFFSQDMIPGPQLEMPRTVIPGIKSNTGGERQIHPLLGL